MTARAMRLIADGIVDREGIDGLARSLGYEQRQVRRVLTAELGASPLALARAQRAQTARVLVETTKLPMGDIAFAAGFASIRQFNATMLEVFDTPPSRLRERAARHAPADAARRGVPAAAVPAADRLAAAFRFPGRAGGSRGGRGDRQHLPQDDQSSERARHPLPAQRGSGTLGGVRAGA